MIRNHYGETKITSIITVRKILTGRGVVETTTRIEVKIVTRIGKTEVTTTELVIEIIMEIVEDTETIMDRIGTIMEIMMIVEMLVETTIKKRKISITNYSTLKATRMTTSTTDLIIHTNDIDCKFFMLCKTYSFIFHSFKNNPIIM